MKKYQHPVLGTITLRKNARAKRIILRVKPTEGIIITVPTAVPYQRGLAMLDQNIPWVKKQQAKLQNQQKIWDYQSSFLVRGKPLQIIPTNKDKASLVITASKIDLNLPLSWNIKDVEVQDTIIALLVEALRIEGKNYLPQRTHDLAKQKSIAINNVTIKKTKTRWGSCSNKKNINLSLYLMLLPDELIDYVILHELAHIKHQNHSPAFWQHLENLLPNSKKLDKALNQYQIPF